MAIDFKEAGFRPNEFDFNDCDTGGAPLKGVYHAKITKEEYVDEPNKSPSQNLSFQVLAGTTNGQRGKVITFYLPLGHDDEEKYKNMVRRAMGLGKRLGIYTEEMAKTLEPIPFEKAVGKECIIEVEDHSYEDRATGTTKSTTRISYMGVWRADHPDAPDCPRHGAKAPPKPAAGTGARPEPAKPTAAAKPAAKPAARPAAANVNEV